MKITIRQKSANGYHEITSVIGLHPFEFCRRKIYLMGSGVLVYCFY